MGRVCRAISQCYDCTHLIEITPTKRASKIKASDRFDSLCEVAINECEYGPTILLLAEKAKEYGEWKQ
jgi:hypothetical protein